jgi:hypothetical protein
MKRFVLLLISIFAVSATPTFVSAQDTTATTTPTTPAPATPAPRQVPVGAIIGIVKDSAGQPVPHAFILATRDSTGAKNRVMADPKGVYVIDGLAINESYTLTVARMGYEPEMRSGVSVPDTTPVIIDFFLDRNYREKVEKAQPLPGITIKAKRGGSPLARKYLGYDEIQNAKVPNALTLIERLRPGFLGPEYDICMTGDSLSLYVDGVRRPPINPPDDNAAFEAMGVTLGMPASRTIQMGRNRGRVITAEMTNEDIVRDELSKIPRDEIFEVKYVGCGDWDPTIGKRDVIWVTTLWSKRSKMIDKVKKDFEKIKEQQQRDSLAKIQGDSVKTSP